MDASVSICIPTYKRGAFLRSALQSVIDADIKPKEIIIGDNSGGDAETNEVIAKFAEKLPITHIVHDPPLNYGGNLNAILTRAQSDWVSVLHDDDFYLPGCGGRFRFAQQECDFDFYFSDHLISSNDGTVLVSESLENSKVFNRTSLKRGSIEDPMASVLLFQVCMDGWFAKRELIHSFQADSRWPEYVDSQLLVHFARTPKAWFYDNAANFVYRISAQGLTASGIKVHELFDFYSSLALDDDNHIYLRDRLIAKYAPVAVTCWLRVGEKKKARACLQSKCYPVPRTIRGAAKYVIQRCWAYLPIP